MYYRIVEDQNIWYLNCNARIRSNDAWGAFFMNIFGLTMFNRDIVATKIHKLTDKEVRLGRFNWQADSFHIYGKDIEAFKQRLYNRVFNSKFEDRVYNFYSKLVQDIWEETNDI
jgi:thymidylate synthase